jgi:hypothetical protein
VLGADFLVEIGLTLNVNHFLREMNKIYLQAIFFWLFIIQTENLKNHENLSISEIRISHPLFIS